MKNHSIWFCSLKILKVNKSPFLLWWTLPHGDSPCLLIAESWRSFDIWCYFYVILFLYHLIVSAQNLPVGPLSCDKTAGTWQVARVNSLLSHFISNCDTHDEHNPSFKWTHFFSLRKLSSCLWAVKRQRTYPH